MSVFQPIVRFNRKLSTKIDSALPERMRTDGNRFFIDRVLPGAVSHGNRVYDMGGGSCPFISLERKQALDLHLTGLDVDGEELRKAPAGIYDETIVHDLCTFVGKGDADAVVCQSTLEHVPDMPGAIRALASTVKPGGRVYMFCPSRHALFARLNVVLPEEFKRKMLFGLFPEKAGGHDGFKAYYDCCTPSEIEALAKQNGLEVERRELFWISSYFKVFTPAFIAWRAYQGLSRLVLKDDAAETFLFVFRKPEAA